VKKSKKIKANKDVVDGWMGTYGDMVTLLMAFFVMLYSAADPDPGKMEEIQEAMKETFASKKSQNEFKDLKKEISDVIDKKNLDDQLNVKLGPNGIKIQIPGKTLFQSGSANIISEMQPVIEEISRTITQILDESIYQDYMIEVEGHTDDVPIKTNEFNSNWDLSAIRATGIVEILNKSGIKKSKLVSIARADTKPLFPNKDIEGNPIPTNRAKNRRVEININKYK